MTIKTIVEISVCHGWKVSFTRSEDTVVLHFSRRTLSGVPFSFTIETEACRGKDVCREIMSLVDALDPERCVLEWMMKSGTMFPLQFDRAVADMEDIRTRTWLLAYDLGVSSGLMQPIPFS